MQRVKTRGENPTMYDSVVYNNGGRFSAKKGWRHPDRYIDDTEIIIVLKGTVYMVIGDSEYAASAGDILRLPPHERHYGSRDADGDVSIYWLHFSGATEEELPPKYFRPESISQAELITKQLLHYAGDERYPSESANCLIRVLLMELKTEYMRLGADENMLFSSVLKWVKDNSHRAVKVSDVAAHFRYNEDYLNRMFRRFYPTGLKAYIDAQRLQGIKNALLDGKLTLREISYEYGFSDHKCFLKYFKYHEGMSPTRYRMTFCDMQERSERK